MVTLTPPRLLGICSPVMGSGKSEVAKRLCGRIGPVKEYPWQAVKFAAPLKAMADALLAQAGVPMLSRNRMLEGDLKETPVSTLGGLTPRRILQTLGTEWGRNTLGKDFWVSPAMGHVDALLAQGYSVVIDDLRFANEADAITDRGGLLVRVIRPNVPAYAAHSSEGELDRWNMLELVNDGSLEDLYAKVGKLARGDF